MKIFDGVKKQKLIEVLFALGGCGLFGVASGYAPLRFMLFTAMLLYLFAMVFYTLGRLKKIKISKIMGYCLNTVSMFSVIFLFVKLDRYSFIQNDSLSFWGVPLALGLFAAAVSLIYMIKHKQNIKKIILFTVIIGIFVSLITRVYAYHINYVFDSGEPVQYVGEIIEKDYYHASKNSKKYIFRVMCDGEEIKFKVSRSAYRQYNEGDSFSFKRVEGALGKPFYLQ